MPHLTADDLRQAFAAATQALERHREAINALNVFPVPDGDTGTNMLLTMRSAMERCPRAIDSSLAEVAGGLADGAFWGARGNSGVILSQFLKGFAQAFEEIEVCRTADLARAFSLATGAAYQAVGQPVEGTMLTVIHSLSSAAQEYGDGGAADPRVLWEKAFRAGQEALDRTPDQLPVLREAGVVDAGGMGVVVIMGGALSQLYGRDDDEQVAMAVARGYTGPDAGRSAGVDVHYLDSVSESQWGYCTQFVISGEDLSPESIRQHFADTSESAVVVGDGRTVRVHVHAPDPGPSLSLGASLGQLNQIEIQNIDQQNRDFVAGLSRPAAGGDLAVVAVARGDGLDMLFREVGCAVVVSGGPTANPSVRDILGAVESAGAKETIILPNNKNVVAAAEQAAANNGVHVVPSESVPQGVAAILAFNPERSVEENIAAMNSALAGVVTIEVTKAVRPSSVDQVIVATGQYIGLLEGKIVAAGETAEQVLEPALALAGMSPSQVVTLYLGDEANRKDAEALRQRLEQLHPGMQVDLVDGGQPHYHYLASVE